MQQTDIVNVFRPLSLVVKTTKPICLDWKPEYWYNLFKGVEK
jgi:hypothetical protein